MLWELHAPRCTFRWKHGRELLKIPFLNVSVVLWDLIVSESLPFTNQSIFIAELFCRHSINPAVAPVNKWKQSARTHFYSAGLSSHAAIRRRYTHVVSEVSQGGK